MCFSCSQFRRLNNLLVHHMLFFKTMPLWRKSYISNYEQVLLTKWITNAKADKPLCVHQLHTKWLWLHHCQWRAQRETSTSQKWNNYCWVLQAQLGALKPWSKGLDPSCSAPSTFTQPLGNRLSKAAQWINSTGFSGVERGWQMKYGLPVSVWVLFSAL